MSISETAEKVSIVAVDPASYKTGYAIYRGNNDFAYGEIVLPKLSLPLRLKIFYERFFDLALKTQPKVIVSEDQFVHRNLDTFKTISAVKDVIILIAGQLDAEFIAYAPQHVKKVLTGKGIADKKDVLNMVKQIFKIPPQKKLTDNEADALAILYTYLKKEGRILS